MPQAEAKTGFLYITQADFSGGVNIVANPVKLAENELSDARNYVIDDTDLRQRYGFTLYNSSAIGTTTAIRSFYQFKNIRGDQHLVAQADDGVIYLGSAAVPTTGSFTALLTESSSPGVACFTEIDHKLIMTNGVDHPQIYEGTYGECQGFLVTRSTTAPVDTDESATYIDSEVQVSDEDSATYAFVGALPTAANGGQIFIGSFVPKLTGVRIVFATANAAAVTVTAQYWSTSGWTTCPATVTDGTSGFTASGDITWGTITTTAPFLINDQHRYWIRLTVSAALDAGVKISAVYLKYKMQDLPQTWDGVLDNPIHCVVTMDNGATYTSYLTEVIDDSATTGMVLDSLSTVALGDWFIVGASTKFSSVWLENLKPNGNAVTLVAAYYKESTNTWATLTIAKDGTLDAAGSTKTLAKDGYASFVPPTDWIMSDVSGRGTPAYEIRFSASGAVDTEVEISAISVIPYANPHEPYKFCLGFKDRLVLGAPLSEQNRIDISGESNIYGFTGEDTDTRYIASNLSITALLDFYNEVFVSTAEEIYFLQGSSPANFSFLRIETEKVGVLNQASLVSWGKNLYFVHSNGFYSFDGTGVQNISTDKINSFFNPRDTTNFIPLTRLPYVQGRWNPQDAVVEWTISKGSAQATNNFIVTYSPEKKAWMFHDFVACSMGNLVGTNGEMQAYHGDYTGKLHQANAATTDNSVAITSYVSTRGFSGGELKNLLCMYRGIQIRAKAQSSGSLVVSYALDGASSFSSFCTISMEGSSSFIWLPFYDPLHGLSLIYKITNSTSGVIPIINELKVPFNPIREEELFAPSTMGTHDVSAAVTAYWNLCPWIDARDYDTLEAADVAAVAAGKLLLISTNWTLTANTALASRVLRIPGGSFTKASTYSLTINGKFQNPDNGQCFIGFTTGVTFGVESVDSVRSEWFGAKGDGSTDNTIAMDSAILSSLPIGIPLKFGVGEYRFTKLTLPVGTGSTYVNYMIIGSGCPNLLGEGNLAVTNVGGTVLRSTAADGSHAITYTAGGAFPALTIRDLELRGPDSDVPTTTSGDGLHLGNAQAGPTIRLNLENISVNHYGGGYGIWAQFCENGGGRNVTVSRNKCGMKLTNASNANTWVNFVAQVNYTNALIITGSVVNTFFGGLIQGNLANSIYLNDTGQISFYGIHFENDDATNHAIYVEGTSGKYNSELNFIGCRFAAVADDVYFKGVSDGTNYSISFLGSRRQSGGTMLTIADNYTYYVDLRNSGMAGTIVNNGQPYAVMTGTFLPWVPTFAVAVLSGYDYAIYRIDGNTVFFEFDAENRTLSGAAGQIAVTLPVPVAATTGFFPLSINVYDGSAWIGPVYANLSSGDTSLAIYKTAAATNWVGNETGVTIRISGWYRY